MTCFDRYACVRDALKVCTKCRFYYHDSSFCHTICKCLRKRCDNVDKSLIFKTFSKTNKNRRARIRKSRTSRWHHFCSHRKTKKNAIVDLKQWRRNHEYIYAIANFAQSTIIYVQILTNQLNERLTKTKTQIIDLQKKMKKTRIERMKLKKMIEKLTKQNEKLLNQMMTKNAQLTINKRNISFFHFLIDWLQNFRSKNDDRKINDFERIFFDDFNQWKKFQLNKFFELFEFFEFVEFRFVQFEICCFQFKINMRWIYVFFFIYKFFLFEVDEICLFSLFVIICWYWTILSFLSF